MYKTLWVLFFFAGQSNQNIFVEASEKIYGGYDVSIERAPYFVQIIKRNQTVCGGSVLRQEVVLTAGHCVYKDLDLETLSNPKDIQVIAGSDRILQGTRIKIKAFSLHPNFALNMYGAMYNDVALLLLETSLEYSNRIQPIPIANNRSQLLVEGNQVFIVGFGYYEYLKQPDHLQGILLPKASEQKCDEFLSFLSAQKDAAQLCLGNVTVEGKDTCSGDSGGPVTYNEMLYATVSYGYGCGELGYPGVYSNLIALNGWIRQAAKDMGFPIA